MKLTFALRTLTAAGAILCLSGCVHDTLADAGIFVDGGLVAQGIDPGTVHQDVPPMFGGAVTPPHLALDPVQIRAMGPVVFLGDSIIAGLNVSGIAPRTLNLAVSGTLTSQILASEAKAPINTRVIYVEGGVNDFLNATPQQIVANYAKIIAAAPAGAQIKILGILPVNEQQLASNRDFLQFVDNQKIAAVNAQIASTCAMSARCSFIAVPAVPTVDGIHPTPQGQVSLINTIKSH